MTYMVDGRQYIAVTTGLGGGSPRNVPSLLAPEIRFPTTGQAIYVFASTGETDTATRAIRDGEMAGPILAENRAAFFGAIVRAENVTPFRRSPPITWPTAS